MLHDELSEMEELDSLAAELAEAGRAARVAADDRSRPAPEFAMRLRAELLNAAAAPAGAATEAPVPPARALNAPERFAERRRADRPFMGTDHRYWTYQPEISGLDGASVPAPMGVDSNGREDEDPGLVTALKPSVRWHLPTLALPSRWIAAGLAASLVVATFLYGGGIFWSPRSVATANEAVAATLVRGSASSPLVSGTALREGDEIKTASAGRATLLLGGSYVRLAGGADLRLTSLDPNHLAVSQIAGRVYHRVAVPAGGDYTVSTATVTWTAHGTAFDLNRFATSGGGEQVRGLALYDGLDVAGPQLEASLSEGTSATVTLSPDGATTGSPVIEPITLTTLDDDWLVANAGIDARLGLPLGQLASVVTPEPTSSPAPEATETAAAQPTDAATPSSAPTPTSAPTATPTPKPTPRPTTAGPGYLGNLSITHNGDGSYSFAWPAYTGSGFQYYKLVYGSWGTSPSYPGSPYWAANDSPTANAWSGTVDAGDYAVRLQVVDLRNGTTIIRAQTNIVHLIVTASATLPPTQNLGALVANDTLDGVTFSWNPYTGGPFNYYKLVYEPTSSGKTPSYPDGSQYWAVPGPGDTSAGPIVIPPGDYYVRIQAIGYPNGHAYAYAQTTVIFVHISAGASPTPPPTPTPSPSPTPSGSPTA